jgi:hypothetical protein
MSTAKKKKKEKKKEFLILKNLGVFEVLVHLILKAVMGSRFFF